MAAALQIGQTCAHNALRIACGSGPPRKEKAMELQRQISRRLYEEHIAVLALLERFEKALLRLQGPPEARDAVWSLLLPQLETALKHEVTRHFALEEEQLFPRLHEHGAGDLAELLLEEHELIRAVTGPLIELVACARTGALDAGGWQRLKTAGLELAERLGSHAQKEQSSLVPLVEEILDEHTDGELAMEYAAG
jgi:hemerythrin-like domain-containing protein